MKAVRVHARISLAPLGWLLVMRYHGIHVSCTIHAQAQHMPAYKSRFVTMWMRSMIELVRFEKCSTDSFRTVVFGFVPIYVTYRWTVLKIQMPGCVHQRPTRMPNSIVWHRVCVRSTNDANIIIDYRYYNIYDIICRVYIGLHRYNTSFVLMCAEATTRNYTRYKYMKCIVMYRCTRGFCVYNAIFSRVCLRVWSNVAGYFRYSVRLLLEMCYQ